jgi:PEP-CTERM motif-containing protein
MRVSVLLFTLAASVFTLSPARATSLTIDFPTAGDTWGEIASGTQGILGAGGYPSGYTPQLKSAGSYVTSSGNTYPVLDNFVATGFTATYNIYATQYDTVDYSIGGTSVQIFLPDCCGGELYSTGPQTLPYPTLLSSTKPITFTLVDDVPQSNPGVGNWIQFGSGTVTLDGYYATPEASTWTMMLLGFAGVAFAGCRASRKRAAVAA